jgi:hypothetical protein
VADREEGFDIELVDRVECHALGSLSTGPAGDRNTTVTSVSTSGSRGVTAARPDLHHSGDKAGQEEQMTRVDLYQEAQAR